MAPILASVQVQILKFKKKKKLVSSSLAKFPYKYATIFYFDTDHTSFLLSLSLSLSLVSVISAVTKKHGWRCSIRRHYKRNQGGSFSRSRAQGEETFMSKVTQIWLFGHRVPQLSWSSSWPSLQGIDTATTSQKSPYPTSHTSISNFSCMPQV